jgi:Zn-dependent M28 family amino/carboxypeptidase
MTPVQPCEGRGRGVARRLATLAVVLLLVGCSPAPSPVASSPARSFAVPTAGASQPAASGALGDAPALATELSGALDPAAILADLQHLQDLAASNDGNRAAGGESEAAAAAYVADELRAAGFTVENQEVTVPWFHQVAPSALEVDGLGSPLEDGHDFRAMLLSGSGDVTGPLFALDFDPAAQPGDSSGSGCDPADWADVPKGAVVLVRPAQCFRRDAVLNAQEAGVAALITAYPQFQRDSVLRPTLIDPTGIEIPAIATSNEAGLALLTAAQDGATAHLVVETTIETRTSVNVVAETAGGSADHVLIVGGHIDSAVDGAGINDDGSGTMTVLEIGRQLAAATSGPQSVAGDGWKVRFGFWTGEEIALLGSTAYTDSLTPDEVGAVEAYLNLDMLGSINGVREVYGAQQSTRPAESQAVTDLFLSAFQRAGLSSTVVELGGGSDHGPFNNVSIPIGGLFSGANETKTAEQAALFGGTAGSPQDPCYHLPCDTVENVDPVRLEEMARAAAWVVGALASGEVTLRPS